jgi:hypothetical protein
VKSLPSLKIFYLALILSYSPSSQSAIITYNYTGLLQFTYTHSPGVYQRTPFAGESNVSGAYGYDNAIVDDMPDYEWTGLYRNAGYLSAGFGRHCKVAERAYSSLELLDVVNRAFILV